MSMTTPNTQVRLTVVPGEGMESANQTATTAQRDRIRLRTIFIEPERRQEWINKTISDFWQHNAVKINHLVDQIPAEISGTSLTVIKTIRTSFLVARKLTPEKELTNFLDSLATLAYHCYRQIAGQTIEVRQPQYTRAYTSTDMYPDTPASTNSEMKSPADLATLITQRNFNLDTSAFDKDIAEASVLAVKNTAKRFSNLLSPEDLYQYLLVIFTAFNQKKAISHPNS